MAIHKQRLLITGLLLAAACPAAAEGYRIASPNEPLGERPDWKCEQCPREAGWHGEIGLGGGYQSETSARFGNLSGEDTQGTHVLLDGQAGYRDEGSGYAEVEGRDLGLERYMLRAEAGHYDGARVEVAYAELPYFYSRAGQTPYLTDGSHLRLPAGWVDASTTGGMSALAGSLQPFEQSSVRKQLKLALQATPANNPWRPRLDYRHELKEATLASSGAFLTRAANVPRPVDHTTDQLDLGISYQQPKWLLDLAYYGSLFRNRLDSLSWDNPYLLEPETGQLALEPDNSYQQLRLSGLYLWERQQLHAQLAYGVGRSEAELLPYSTLAAFAGRELPTSGFEGEYHNLVADIGWINRLNTRLTLRAGYDYRSRDDRSPEFTFQPVAGDLLPGTGPVVNRRNDLNQHRFKLEGDYRISRDLRFSAGYNYRQDQRDPRRWQQTREHTLFLDTLYRRWRSADLGWKLAYSVRDGAAPDDADERLRLFYLADRRRLETRLSVGYHLSETLTLDTGAQWGRDDYPNSEVGVTEGEDLGLDLSLSYQPSATAEWHAFANRQWYHGKQQGASTANRIDWHASERNRQLTLGVGGVRREAFDMPLELGMEYLLGYGKGITRVEPASGVDSGYPDLTTRLQRLQFWGLHALADNHSLRLELIYERYREQDYAYSDLAPDSIDHVLTFGDLNNDYHAWFTRLMYLYRF